MEATEEGKRERRVRLLRVSCACSTLPPRPLPPPPLSTGSPEDKLPRNKNTEKIICLLAARASGERRAKGPLGFSTNAGKRRAEDSDAEKAGKRKRGRRRTRANERASGGKETALARKEKSAKVRQERTKEEIEVDCRMKRGKREREKASERVFFCA